MTPETPTPTPHTTTQNTAPASPSAPSPGLVARAQRRVRRKMGFYLHAFVFTAVHGVFALKHLLTRAPCPIHIVWGWAMALAIHGAWVWFTLQGEGLRERLLRQEIERLQKASPPEAAPQRTPD
jgi:hypothetical protein